MKNILIYIFFFLPSFFLFAQALSSMEELMKKANSNYELLRTHPNKALKNAIEIEKIAQSIGAKSVELRILDLKCAYYVMTSNFEQTIFYSEKLSQKAKDYKQPIYEIIAQKHLFNGYLFSGLPERALQELILGEKLLNKIGNKDTLSITTRANIYSSFSNYYSIRNDHEKSLVYTKISGQNLEDLPPSKFKDKMLYIYYSNLGFAYKLIKENDSAKFYIQKSISIGKDIQRVETSFINLNILAEIALEEKSYSEALNYFQKAEKLSGYKNQINIVGLYDGISKVYKKIGKEDSVKIYQAKQDSLNFFLSKNQNELLKTLLNKKESNFQRHKYVYILLSGIAALLLLLLGRRLIVNANRERISESYLEKVVDNPSFDNYSNIMELLKKNDPGFLSYFSESFPGFIEKLKTFNSKLSSSEIEFCAMLKLKLSTKDIAKYKFLAPQTVRNKKHIIRKKLNIATDTDIYEWFHEI